MGLHGDIGGGGRAVYYNSYNNSSWSDPGYGLNRYPDYGINADYNGGSGWSEPNYGWNNGYPDHRIDANDQAHDLYGYHGGRNAMGYQPQAQEVYEVMHDSAGGWGHDYSPPNPNRENQHHLLGPWHADAGHEYSAPRPLQVKVHTGSNHNKPRISHSGGGYKHDIPPNNHLGAAVNSKPHDHGGNHGSKAHERQNHMAQVKPSTVPIITPHYGNKHENEFDTDSDDESVFTPRSRKPAVQKVHEKPSGPNHAQVNPSHVPITAAHNGKRGNPNNRDDDEFDSSGDEESDDE